MSEDTEAEYERESDPVRLKYRELVKFLNENDFIQDEDGDLTKREDAGFEDNPYIWYNDYMRRWVLSQ